MNNPRRSNANNPMTPGESTIHGGTPMSRVMPVSEKRRYKMDVSLNSREIELKDSIKPN